MNKKFVATVFVLSTFSLILSACSTRDKLEVGIQNQTDLNATTSGSDDSVPATDPSSLSDEELLLRMESDSDASIDQEFSRLESELE